MPNLVTKNYKRFISKRFLDTFEVGSDESVYLFCGGSVSWDDDNNPPTPSDDLVDEYELRRNILFMKKVSYGNVTLAISRKNWTSGIIYDVYADNVDLSALNYYVLTEDFNVYICLDNNNDSRSLYKPTSTSLVPFETLDGYLWKFMYSITDTQKEFLTDDHVPVHFLIVDDGSLQWDVQQAAANGSIEVIRVVDGGNGYFSSTGNAISANSTTITTDITGTYEDELKGSSIYISGGDGLGQLREILSWNEITKCATVSTWDVTPTSNSSYVIGPKITVSGDASNSTLAYATVNATSITDINVIDSGLGYSHADVVVTANNGSGANCFPVLSPIGGFGSNPVNELPSFNVIVKVDLTRDESNTFITENDIRILGFIIDPLTVGGNVATDTVYDCTTTLTVSNSTGDFYDDEMVTGSSSNNTGYIVEYRDTDIVSLTNVSGDFEVDETLLGANSAMTAKVVSQANNDLNINSGEIIYIENRTPILRNPAQTESFKILISF